MKRLNAPHTHACTHTYTEKLLHRVYVKTMLQYRCDQSQSNNWHFHYIYIYILYIYIYIYIHIYIYKFNSKTPKKEGHNICIINIPLYTFFK